MVVAELMKSVLPLLDKSTRVELVCCPALNQARFVQMEHVWKIWLFQCEQEFIAQLSLVALLTLTDVEIQADLNKQQNGIVFFIFPFLGGSLFCSIKHKSVF